VISQYDSILLNYRESAFMNFDYLSDGGARLADRPSQGPQQEIQAGGRQDFLSPCQS
jgi:hypothetical protein